MKALDHMKASLAHGAWICAMGMLTTGCGGGDNAETAPVAPANMARESVAMAPIAEKAALKTKMPPGRAWRGITAMDVAPDGSVVLAGADGTVQLRSDAGEIQANLVEATGVAATAVTFTPDGKTLIGVGRDSVARVWDVASRKRLLSLHGHEHPIRSVVVSADGKLVVTAGEETRVIVWNAGSGKLAQILGGHAGFVNTLAFSSDSRMLASGDATGRVIIWNLADGAPRHRLQEHRGNVNSLVFSPDGRYLATAGEDGRVVLVDADSGKMLQALDGHKVALRALAFSRDSRWLAAAGVGGDVLVWDTATWMLSRTMSAGTGAAVNALSFDVPKRKQVLLVGDEDGRVSRWDVIMGEPR